MSTNLKNILISQPEPKVANSPYSTLIEKTKIKVDFEPFISIKPVNSRRLREQKIKLSDFTSIILTSRNAIDNFFRIAEEMKYKVPDSTRYFCTSEAVASYLQKYIIYRKRKVYVGGKIIKDLEPYFKTHKKESFFLPSSDVLSPAISEVLDNVGINWVRGILYKTVSSDLSHLELNHDILVLFTPSGVESLFKNFPDFKQESRRIAAFGKATLKAAQEAGLNVDIEAPTKETPSMIMALEKYLKNNK